MKAFIMKKRYNDKALYCAKQEKSIIKLNEDKRFNYVLIKNPKNSRCICTIENISLKIQERVNSLCLLIGQDERHDDGKKCDMFSIESTLDNEENTCENLLELDIKRVEKTNEIKLLTEAVIILLPNGGLYLRFQNPINSLGLDIDWSKCEFSN